MEYQGVTLETLNSGAVAELFGVEWDKLIQNIVDPNTRPDAVRKVKIEITVKPAKDRRNASTSVSVVSSLANIVPHESSIVVGVENGKVQAFAFDPKQENLDFDDKAGPLPFPGREAK
ncbi:hypothetical protein FACS189447_09540 [Spirochaetia bacterium]|nr:hypothetical protein FACS189447_09540 [Spirochaetia bacterium]